MPHRVLLTRDAVNGLEEPGTWIATHDSPGRADYGLDRTREAFRRLAELPERRTCPKELSAPGIREFREAFSKPYRIISRVERHNVYVYLVADGRRGMQTLLGRRLLTD